jgi:preprotein translocase subunit SecG
MTTTKNENKMGWTTKVLATFLVLATLGMAADTRPATQPTKSKKAIRNAAPAVVVKPAASKSPTAKEKIETFFLILTVAEILALLALGFSVRKPKDSDQPSTVEAPPTPAQRTVVVK